MSKHIVLTQGQFAIVDDEDYEALNTLKWYACKTKYTFYAATKICNVKTLMHRFILGATDPKDEIDHRDHNGLNNQKDNLRFATKNQNKQNNNKYSGEYTSTFKGVFYAKGRDHWIASISFHRKQIYIGSFKNEIEAAIAYNKKAKELFCQFALLNKIPGSKLTTTCNH